MRIIEKSFIDRPAAAVWPFIITSENFKTWNEKIVSTEASGEFRLGQTFVTHYRMSAREIQCTSVATAVEPGRFLEIRHRGMLGNGVEPDMEVRERITLEESGGRTTVTKEVLIPNRFIPWFLIPLIWFINRFGHRAGPDKLKALCEAGGTAA